MVQSCQTSPKEWFIVRSRYALDGRPLPSEVTTTDRFVTLSEGALECRVKRSKDVVKLKLRTPRQLYTYKVKVDRADDVLRRLKCEVVEV